MKRFSLFGCWLLLISSLFSLPALANDNITLPVLTKRVTDLTNTLTPQQQQNLEQQIISFEHDHPDGSQLAVLMISTLGNNSIEDYADQIFKYWQLGQKGKDNGVLLLIALHDRIMRIEVGYGLEGQLTDLQTNRIINNKLAPNFKNGDYYTGIAQAIDAINQIITEPVDISALYLDESTIIELAFTGGLIVFILQLIGIFIKPKQKVASRFKLYICLLVMTILLFFIYRYTDTTELFNEVLNNTGLFAIMLVIANIMLFFLGFILQLIIALPLFKLFCLVFYSGTNKIIPTFKIYSRTAILITLPPVITFILLPAEIKMFTAIFGIFILIILGAIFGKGRGRSSRSSGSSSWGGGGFSGGGGRSGGGGSSGRW